MGELLLVGLGGCIGSILRYLLSGFVFQQSGAAHFPWGTLAVNVMGCFVIGLITSFAQYQHVLTPGARLFLITGILGGFTTFSAFGYETLYLVRTGLALYAAANVLGQVALGLGAVWVGHVVGTLWAHKL